MACILIMSIPIIVSYKSGCYFFFEENNDINTAVATTP
jgi:hypothetical protein